jgi:GTP cyclohydrolase I
MPPIHTTPGRVNQRPAMPDADPVSPRHERAEDGIRALLQMMGEDPTRPGLLDTPKRVVRAYLEMADTPGEPDQFMRRTFPDVEAEAEMITVPGIEFVSICEHHLLPFTGAAVVSYIPGERGVVGLSKIPRLVQHFAHRPQVQERLTTQIADAMVHYLEPVGAAVSIRATHACMALRGVRAQGAEMVTAALRGRYLDDARTRAEFQALINGRH